MNVEIYGRVEEVCDFLGVDVESFLKNPFRDLYKINDREFMAVQKCVNVSMETIIHMDLEELKVYENEVKKSEIQ